MIQDRIADRWLRRRFSVLCWTVVIYELLLNILCAVAISADALRQILQAMQSGDFSGMIDEERLLQNGWGDVATFAVGAVILYGWKGRNFFQSDRKKKPGPMSAGASSGYGLCGERIGHKKYPNAESKVIHCAALYISFLIFS